MNDIASVRRRRWEMFAADSEPARGSDADLKHDEKEKDLGAKGDDDDTDNAIPSEFECILCLR